MMLRDLPPDHKRWLGGKALRHRLAKKFSHTITERDDAEEPCRLALFLSLPSHAKS